MHILILRPGALGDTLLTFPLLQALRTTYVACQITFIGNSIVLPLALTSGLVDEAFDYEDSRWTKLFIPGGLVNTSDPLFTRISMAICWLRDPEGIVETNLLAAGVSQIFVAPGRPVSEQPVHIVEYLAQTVHLAEQVSLTSWSSVAFTRSLATLPALPGQQMERHIAIHPGSGGVHKCWPVSNFATIISALWQQNIPVLLLGGPADHDRLCDLSFLLPTPPQPALFTQLLDAPLLKVAQYLQHCRGYLGNDSGPTHLAALLGLRTLALFGPSDPRIWRPIGSNVRVLSAASSIADIQSMTVLSNIETWITTLRSGT